MSLLTSLRPWYALAALTLGVVASAQAQLAFNVSLNTSNLISANGGPFYLDFQLNDGSQLGDGSNSVKLSNFNFGSGSAGGVTGSLGSSVTLKDTSNFNEFYQAFTPGASLSFTVSSTAVFTGSTPDSFSFAILDKLLFNIPTLDPGLTDSLAILNITGPNSVVKTYAENNAIPIVASGGSLNLPAPAIVPVPEPATYGLIGAGVLLCTAIWRRRNRPGTSASVV
jgi:hypothetical protein